MFEINQENVASSVELLLKGNTNIIDLLNDVLTDEGDLALLLKQNNVTNVNTKLPGLIIQAYVLLVDLFGLDFRQAVNRIKSETDFEVLECDSTQQPPPPPLPTEEFSVFSDFSSSESKTKKRKTMSKDDDENTATSERVFNCSTCSKAFKQNSYRVRHEQRVHGDKTLPCEQCDKMYALPDDLKWHVKIVHGTDLACDNCEFKTSSNYQMKAHVRDRHSGAIFQCSTCCKTFTMQCTLKEHVTLVHAKKSLNCDHCERMFVTPQQIKKHFREDHLIDEVRCEECDKVCQNRTKLADHRRATHSAPSSAKFEWSCGECSFVVRRRNKDQLKQGVKSHCEVHSEVKPWLCEYCSKQFRQRHHWVSHMNTHQGVFPYECVPCTKRYPSRELLSQHFRKGSQHKDAAASVAQLFDTLAKVHENLIN